MRSAIAFSSHPSSRLPGHRKYIVNSASTLSSPMVSIDRKSQAGRNATSALASRSGKEPELKSTNAAGISSQRLPGSSFRSAMPSSHSSCVETCPPKGRGGKARINLSRKSSRSSTFATSKGYCRCGSQRKARQNTGTSRALYPNSAIPSFLSICWLCKSATHLIVQIPPAAPKPRNPCWPDYVW
jgi:hypothetical protein